MPTLEEFINFNKKEVEEYLKPLFNEYSKDKKYIEEPYLHSILNSINSDLEVENPITLDEIYSEKKQSDFSGIFSTNVISSGIKFSFMDMFKGPNLISYQEYLSLYYSIRTILIQKNM